MPTTPFRNSFDRETRHAMRLAFVMASTALGLEGRNDHMNKLVAEKIIELAQGGERDSNVLCDRTLSELGKAARDAPWTGMDADREREHLAQADRHIAQFRAYIARQRRIVEQPALNGQRRQEAVTMLAGLKDTLRIIEQHRELILEALQRRDREAAAITLARAKKEASVAVVGQPAPGAQLGRSEIGTGCTGQQADGSLPGAANHHPQSPRAQEAIRRLSSVV